MTTLNGTILPGATEKIIAYLDKDSAHDSFLDQTVHAHEHGVELTELGRLVLDERVQANYIANA